MQMKIASKLCIFWGRGKWKKLQKTFAFVVALKCMTNFVASTLQLSTN